MAVSTRGASIILVDSIAIDLKLKQVEFICFSLTIETKELKCSWPLAIVLQVQPEMKWNGWCVDEMSACLKSKTNVSSSIINQWRSMYMERACNSASWTNLVEHLWLSPLNMSCITYWSIVIPDILRLSFSILAFHFHWLHHLPSTKPNHLNFQLLHHLPPFGLTLLSPLPLLEGIDHVHLDLQGIWKVHFGRWLFMPWLRMQVCTTPLKKVLPVRSTK